MKNDKIIVDNKGNKNIFIIAWVSCIVVLFIMCLVGVNSSVKGTNAIICPSGTANIDDTDYCCPTTYGYSGVTIKKYNGVNVCYPNSSIVSDYSLICADEGCTATVSYALTDSEYNSFKEYLPKGDTSASKITNFLNDNSSIKTKIIDIIEAVLGEGNGWQLNPNYDACSWVSDGENFKCSLTAPFEGSGLLKTNALEKPNSVYKYNIQYNLNGGTSGTNAPTTDLYSGDEVQISNPTKKFVVKYYNLDGYDITGDSNNSVAQTFLGWVIDEENSTGTVSSAKYLNGSKYEYFSNTTEPVIATNGSYSSLNISNGTTVLEAKWDDATIQLATIDSGNDGEVCFWSTNDDGTGETYAPGGYLIISNDLSTKAGIDLYAQCSSEASIKISGVNRAGERLSAVISSPTNTTCSITSWSYCINDSCSSTANNDSYFDLTSAYISASISVSAMCTCSSCSSNSRYNISDVTDSINNVSDTVLRALPTLVVNPTSLSLDVGTSGEISYADSVYDGVVSCVSNDENIVRCTKDSSSKKLIVDALSNGSTNVVLKVASGSRYDSGEITIPVTVSGDVISKPTKESNCNSLTYNGEEQILTKDGTVGYEFSNNKGTNAGVYTVTAKLLIGYQWSDGSIGDVTFGCEINKAVPNVTLNKVSGSVNVGEKITFTIKSDVIGSYEITSGSASKAIVTPTTITDVVADVSKTISITGVSKGSTTISVKFTPKDTVNYNVPEFMKYNVSVNEVVDDPSDTKEVTVYFYNYDGSNKVDTKTCEISSGSTTCVISIPSNLERTGYTFKGWSTNKNCTSGTMTAFSVSSDSNYYACYIKNETTDPSDTKEVTVYFYNYDGSNKVDTKTCEISSGSTTCVVAIPSDLERTGYTFTGWGTNKNCTSGTMTAFGVSADSNYYACYVENTTTESGGESKPNSPNNGGNTNENPGTGDITIAVVWFVGIFAISYVFCYFKSVKQN